VRRWAISATGRRLRGRVVTKMGWAEGGGEGSRCSRHLATFVRLGLPPHYSVSPAESSRTVLGMDCGGGSVRGGEASVYHE
jgi:hypothetical protein